MMVKKPQMTPKQADQTVPRHNTAHMCSKIQNFFQQVGRYTSTKSEMGKLWSFTQPANVHTALTINMV